MEALTLTAQSCTLKPQPEAIERCEHGKLFSEECFECDMEIEATAAAARLARNNG